MEENTPVKEEKAEDKPISAPKEPNIAKNVIQKEIEDEMKKSFLSYAMAVIVSRALPDVRDGLKPVHRRILFAMHELGFMHNKPFKKSARIVGEVLGKFHPHGDTAVYDAMVRMAQNFSLRYPLVQGQGNFGSIDGDSAAAMRYCVTGDNLILTDTGILPIRNISNKKETNIKIGILSYNGKNNTASKFFNSGKHKIIELKTKLGYGVKGSYNHPLMCWTFKNKVPQTEWKLLEDINKNDIIIINRNYSLFSKKSLELRKYYPEKGFKNDIKLPLKMNNDLAFLLGALVSEGSFHNKQILFNNQDEKFYDKVKSIIISQFKGVQLYERKIKGKCTELSIYEQKIVNFLKNIGLSQVKSEKKEIPFSVMVSTKENIKNFLTALFEGDGSVIYKTDKRHGGKSIELTYNSKSITLIEQLKVLLLNFGIVTTNPYKDKRNGCYKLIISGYDSINKYKKEINFFSERKKKILSNIKFMNSQRMSKTDFIPYLNDYLRKKYKKRFVLVNNFDRYNNLEKNYSKLIKIIDSKDKQIIDFILKQKYLFNEVLEVKKLNKKEEVFSVKVNSKCHSFVANGFINHNTEARLSKLAESMLEDIEKDTVDFQPNFDGSLKEPIVLPAKLPNLLINGSSGIAVGMATNIPPFNIAEVIDGIIELINNPELNSEKLINFIKGPDFPTGGIIQGDAGIKAAYKYGRGKVIVKAVTSIEEVKDRKKIIVTEIPYMINKSLLIEQIAELVKSKIVQGISDLRDESDRKGMRIVIELKKEAAVDIILNQLFKHSRLQSTFGINMLALVGQEPRVLNLKQIIQYYIGHRKIVVTRRTKFELRKAEERAHILEGLIIALNNIDDIVKKIKASKSVVEAKNILITDYSLTPIQAQAILDMRLQKLSSLEREKIKNEHKELIKLIGELKGILASEQRILDIIKKELIELKEKFSDERRTEIVSGGEPQEIDIEDLIEEEKTVVTVSHQGYVKRIPLAAYKQQKRGGKGIIAAETKEEDFLEKLFICSTHSYLLVFTDKGKIYWLKVYNIPVGSRTAKGKPIINLIDIEKNEKITAVLPVREFLKDRFLVLVTKNGIIKKTSLLFYSRPRKGGIRAITLDEGDYLVNAKQTDGTKNIMLTTKNGMAIKFDEKDCRAIGRTSRGVKGIELKEKDEVIGMQIARDGMGLLTITENGYGKRTDISDYRLIGRAGVGVINIKCSERNGKVVATKSVKDDDELMFISQKGIAIRVPAKDISNIGRNTQGLRIMKLSEGDKVVAAAKIVNESTSNNS